MSDRVWEVNLDYNGNPVSFYLTQRTIDRYNLFKEHGLTYIFPLLTSITLPLPNGQLGTYEKFILFEITYTGGHIPLKDDYTNDDFNIESKIEFDDDKEIMADDLKTKFLHGVLNGGLGHYTDDVDEVMVESESDIDNLLGHKIYNPQTLEFGAGGGAVAGAAGGGAMAVQFNSDSLSLVNILSDVMKVYPEKSETIRDTSIDILQKLLEKFNIRGGQMVGNLNTHMMDEIVGILTRDIEEIRRQPLTGQLKYTKRSKKKRFKKRRTKRRRTKRRRTKRRRTKRRRSKKRRTKRRII
tara:strand:+ start:59 stop:949 length:891 start_codon:yes stop_codon:yes gene_type:complete